MIDGLKPYPAMKDSGVPWLGEVPEHWEVRRNQALCFARRKSAAARVQRVLSVRISDVIVTNAACVIART